MSLVPSNIIRHLKLQSKVHYHSYETSALQSGNYITIAKAKKDILNCNACYNNEIWVISTGTFMMKALLIIKTYF